MGPQGIGSCCCNSSRDTVDKKIADSYAECRGYKKLEQQPMQNPRQVSFRVDQTQGVEVDFVPAVIMRLSNLSMSVDLHYDQSKMSRIFLKTL